jgi:predicted Mrr-cat superfamily restriction endonuclease
MPNLFCVRADYGTFTQHFIKGGYIAIGWLYHTDLSAVAAKEDLVPLYKKEHPKDTSNIVIGQQVGQIARFLFDIQPSDYVVTPAADSRWLHYGIVEDEPYCFDNGSDGCRFVHRRKVKWSDKRIDRAVFSVPLQNTLRSMLTVFSISQREEFFETIGRKDLVPDGYAKVSADPYELVIGRVLELDPTEFELLVKCLLEALGFETEHTGKTGDGGVDVKGTLDVDGFARIRVHVQAKRYKAGSRIAAKTVRELRQTIPNGAQGAFITTADYQAAARDVAEEAGFPRIGLINGRQMVDLLVKHWLDMDIPKDFKEKLGLRPGLVLA